MKIIEKIKIEIYKFLYKVAHSKKYHHNRKRWPYVKIKRNKGHEIIEFSYKEKKIPLLEIDKIRGKQKGSILLIATGPSINEIELNKELKIPVIGVNGSYYLNSKIDFSFYVVTDIHFPDHRPNIIKEIIEDKNIILFTTIDIIIKIIDKYSEESLNCSVSIIEDLNERIYEPKLNFNDLCLFYKNKSYFHPDKTNKIGFSSDIKDGIFPGKTVVYWTLQIISHLGFEKIYIIGMDMNNFDKPRFYEDKNDKIHTQLNNDIDSIITSLKHASHVLEDKLGIEVINLSPNSAVPESIFKKSEFKKYFN
ncbi:sugar glycosyltransferase [Pectobacterium atrosepticum]|uniref:hypothetical protein n=1 Tax=Pectobacterium atrosepticum TaxID=29471 RepID=UPI0005049B45|nr:hypothetical protein [Pectobacterium atrosepticum]KFX13625.1 hypothetical protein JV34_14910 [Pectobacterium atrosepticum]KFX24209.1 hypothetical protein KP24_08970 [Pectobacterium atrosepticum]KMK83512.1 lipopolysaccharide glycosyltransferase [Pectobacterium atrosepticum ICMP 1526]MCL6392343.1 sugar glycosyltransferase [Pectobacterium atrosepticum]QXE15596.1 sugar glycosyltransferase [Pectobacterium atrosepticum]